MKCRHNWKVYETILTLPEISIYFCKKCGTGKTIDTLTKLVWYYKQFSYLPYRIRKLTPKEMPCQF